ncbi:hypothetical protein [Kitasatospora viridis]|uniref:Uncharacterized protein n=1 Tax=Kitasatospora viridis TaxID=281105 RepID=A0A561UBL9_9ACTN|nr:hypothetical protein [Kitasatospora viridis]TWF96754.1 hypothetical protein FHX73_11526 [Kitasatospora viridis]
MPGSVTIGHHLENPAMVEHADAERLAVLLDELGHLLAVQGPTRLSDEQASALLGGADEGRTELAHWCRGLSARLHDRL